jgi:hypothetical protein
MKRLVGDVITKVSFHILRAVSYRSRAGNVELVVVSTDVDPAATVAVIHKALDELGGRDPRRMRRIQRYLKRIIAVEYGGAMYEPALHACIVGPKALALHPVRLAAKLVHESTHARLYRRGFRYSPATRAWEEAICVAESARFLRRAGRDDWAAEMEAVVARDIASGNPWYSGERRRELAEGLMADHGVPRWMRKVRHYLAGR